jgi:hypothetical protein
MKKLVAIAIAVVVAVSIVVYFARSGDTTPAHISQSEGSPAPAVTEPPDEGNSHESSDSESAATIAAPMTDEQKLAACEVIITRKAEHNNAMLAAEPKDPAWAYPMEQKLREFTSRRFQSSEINVVAVDCRTYYCDIKAQTFDAEKTAKEFAEGMGALREEAWSEFTGSGTWYEEEEGKAFHVARINRPPPPEVTRMMMRDDPGEARLLSDCAAISEEQQQQRRAARDGQERDASWADPMEYRLREYVTAQLSKHPIDHLDIDCRKTFCRLQASGRTNESQAAFQKAAEDASKESWANLWYAEVAGQAENGVWDGSVVLYRRTSQ